MEKIIIIGGGGTGAALAHDLTGRGFEVSLFERGELFSGATGRHHGLLHSGARYAVNDPTAARECFHENQILRKIAPYAIEQNDGLFVAVDDEDLEFEPALLEGCAKAGIPTSTLTGEEARELEPALSPDTTRAVRVPDAVIDAYRLPLSFAASACANGARLHRFHEVEEILFSGSRVSGVKVRDHRREETREVKGDLVINAAGAWAGRLAKLADVNLPIQPGPGVMVAINGRLTERVINHMSPAGEGDIILPQRKLSIVGTSLWLAENPDDVGVPRDHVEKMLRLGSRLIPAIAEKPITATWSASRPLIRDDRWLEAPQQMSRTFQCYDHEALDGKPGLFSVIGGKATTLRAMAELTANEVCQKLGRPELRCRTADEVLLPPRALARVHQEVRP